MSEYPTPWYGLIQQPKGSPNRCHADGELRQRDLREGERTRLSVSALAAMESSSENPRICTHCGCVYLAESQLCLRRNPIRRSKSSPLLPIPNDPFPAGRLNQLGRLRDKCLNTTSSNRCRMCAHIDYSKLYSPALSTG